MQETADAVAKTQVGRAMLQGCSWREAVQAAGVQMSRATAYRLRQRMLADGEAAWHDRRQGHVIKVRGAVRIWLETYYQQHPRAPGKVVQALLEAHFDVRISVTHLNRVRAALTGATRKEGKISRGHGRMGQVVSCCWPPQRNQTCYQHWRRRSPSRGTCPRRPGWRGPLPEPDGSLC